MTWRSTAVKEREEMGFTSWNTVVVVVADYIGRDGRSSFLALFPSGGEGNKASQELTNAETPSSIERTNLLSCTKGCQKIRKENTSCCLSSRQNPYDNTRTVVGWLDASEINFPELRKLSLTM